MSDKIINAAAIYHADASIAVRPAGCEAYKHLEACDEGDLRLP